MHALASTLFLALLLAADPPAVKVLTLDEQTHQGQLMAVEEQAVVLSSQGKTHRLPWEQVIELLPQQPAAETTKTKAWLVLHDGTQLAFAHVPAYDGKHIQGELWGQKLSLSVGQVAHLRLRKPSGEQADQWKEILGTKISGDLVVIAKGESLDYLEGVVRSITPQAVQFELEGTQVPVKLERVFAVVFYRPNVPKHPEPRAFFYTAAGGKVPTVAVAWEQGAFALTTPGGLKLRLPVQQWQRADFSLGKIAYLDQMEPEQETIHPRPLTNFTTRKEQLRLALEEDRLLRRARRGRWNALRPLKLDGREYSRGLGLRTGTELTFRLGGRYSRLQAVVGVDDQVQFSQGPVVLTIRGDDRVLAQVKLSAADRPRAHPLELDVSGVHKLVIQLDRPAGTFLADDFVDLCGIRVLK